MCLSLPKTPNSATRCCVPPRLPKHNVLEAPVDGLLPPPLLLPASVAMIRQGESSMKSNDKSEEESKAGAPLLQALQRPGSS
eukprot:IDg2131t1